MFPRRPIWDDRLLDLIPRISRYGRRGGRISETGEQVLDALKSVASTPRVGMVSESTLDDAYTTLLRLFDEENGGFEDAPKFRPQINSYSCSDMGTGPERARRHDGRGDPACHATGDIDHVGWGFHRYATDAAWLTHTSKMLYDRALLTVAALKPTLRPAGRFADCSGDYSVCPARYDRPDGSFTRRKMPTARVEREVLSLDEGWRSSRYSGRRMSAYPGILRYRTGNH